MSEPFDAAAFKDCPSSAGEGDFTTRFENVLNRVGYLMGNKPPISRESEAWAQAICEEIDMLEVRVNGEILTSKALLREVRKRIDHCACQDGRPEDCLACQIDSFLIVGTAPHHKTS